MICFIPPPCNIYRGPAIAARNRRFVQDASHNGQAADNGVVSDGLGAALYPSTLTLSRYISPSIHLCLSPTLCISFSRCFFLSVYTSYGVLLPPIPPSSLFLSINLHFLKHPPLLPHSLSLSLFPTPFTLLTYLRFTVPFSPRRRFSSPAFWPLASSLSGPRGSVKCKRSGSKPTKRRLSAGANRTPAFPFVCTSEYRWLAISVMIFLPGLVSLRQPPFSHLFLPSFAAFFLTFLFPFLVSLLFFFFSFRGFSRVLRKPLGHEGLFFPSFVCGFYIRVRGLVRGWLVQHSLGKFSFSLLVFMQIRKRIGEKLLQLKFRFAWRISAANGTISNGVSCVFASLSFQQYPIEVERSRIQCNLIDPMNLMLCHELIFEKKKTFIRIFVR